MDDGTHFRFLLTHLEHDCFIVPEKREKGEHGKGSVEHVPAENTTTVTTTASRSRTPPSAPHKAEH